jgi:hypothetical protein
MIKKPSLPHSTLLVLFKEVTDYIKQTLEVNTDKNSLTRRNKNLIPIK